MTQVREMREGPFALTVVDSAAVGEDEEFVKELEVARGGLVYGENLVR